VIGDHDDDDLKFAITTSLGNPELGVTENVCSSLGFRVLAWLIIFNIMG